MRIKSLERRELLRLGGLGLAGAWLIGTPPVGHAAEEKKEEPEAEKVLPAEDLMREHGALSRILLIYDDARTKLAAGQEFPAAVLATAAGLVKTFVEDYHERNEENYLFPRFQKAGKLTDLVKVLLSQHEAGRKITDYVQSHARAETLKEAAERRKMAEMLQLFLRMYRPHKAREDTILFPAIRSVMTAKEYDALGDTFEGDEDKKLGEGGYEKVVEQVAGLEKQLGIYELAQFTPQV